MILAGRLSAWKDYVTHMDLWELEGLISPYEGLDEIIEDIDSSLTC